MILLLVLILLPKLNPPQNFETIRVERKNLTKIVSASGQIEPVNQAILKFQTSGKLAWVGVKEGDTVKKWQAIAGLDKADLEDRLTKALRDYSKERWDFEEEKEVTYKDRIKTDTIKRILEKNQFDLDKAVADVEIAHTAWELATLITPLEGIVTHIDSPQPGINILPTEATIIVVDPKSMKFVANIEETDIALIKEGQTAKVKLDAYPEMVFESKVDRIGFSAIATRGGGTAFEIEVILPQNIDQVFRQGMNGDLEIVIEEKQNVLTVPNGTLFQKDGQSQVRVPDGRKLRFVNVTIGLTNDEETEITSGLNENETVVSRETTSK